MACDWTWECNLGFGCGVYGVKAMVLKVFQFLAKLGYVTVSKSLGIHFERFGGTFGIVLVALCGRMMS